MTTDTLQQESGSDAALKAVVLYDALESGMRAKALLGRVGNKTGEEPLESVFWRLDVITQPPLAAEALDGAMDADMILLVADRIVSSPERLLGWLKTWATSREIQDALLVASCHGQDRTALSKEIECLRELAGHYGLAWLCDEEFTHKAA